MARHESTLGVLACAAWAALPAHAEDTLKWSFGGYGTLGVAHADTREADFSATTLRANGAGHSGRVSARVDSRLGAQASVAMGRSWSAVLQVTAEQRLDGSYRPEVEWANVKVQLTPDLAVRVGRIALPLYLAADYRKVGYAYAFARTPAEVYNAIPVSNSDGVDLAWRWQAGGIKHMAQVSYGGMRMRLMERYRTEVRDLVGLTYTAERGATTLRASAMDGTLSLNLGDQLFAALRQFGPAGTALAARYEPVGKRTTAFSLGAMHDPGDWFVMAEAGTMDGRSVLIKTRSAYASAGWRSGAFTPYLTLARIRAAEPNQVDGLPLAGLPPELAAAGAMLNGALNRGLAAVPVQSSVSAGVRWDAMPNLAVKLQLDRLRPRDGSRGTLINEQPGFRSGHSVHVASALVDFVF